MFHVFRLTRGQVDVYAVGKDAEPDETRFGPSLTTPEGTVVHRVELILAEKVGDDVRFTAIASRELTLEERKVLVAYLEGVVEEEGMEARLGRFDVWTHTMRVREA